MKKSVFLLCLGFLICAKIPTAAAQGVWSDTFADTSKIESSANVAQVTHLSGFGTTFTPYPGNPLLTLESSDPWDAFGDVTRQTPGSVHPDVMYFSQPVDGYKFWMYFTPSPDIGSDPPGITVPPEIPASKYPDYWWERPTLLRSNDGINWVKTRDYTNPLVNEGAPGEWDWRELCDPDAVYAPGKGPGGESWFLYYCGSGSAGTAIGVALSYDGKHFSKYSGNPVIPNYSACPAVVYDDATGIFHAWFCWGSVGGGRIGYATSTDGINWTPYGDWGTIVYQGTQGTFDEGGMSHLDVIYDDGFFRMYYLAQPTAQYTGLVIGLATSPDGIHWTQYPNPVLTPGTETWTFTGGPTQVIQSLYRASPVIVGDTMYIYYGGVDDLLAYPAHNYETGLAFSTTAAPDGHIELEKSFEPAEYAARPDTAAWYHMNEGSAVPVYPGEYAARDQTSAWYHFNEDSGTTTADSGGIINDLGTLEGPQWVPGLYGNGLSFDGQSKVTVLDSAELDPANAITVEAWVNPSVQKSLNYVLIKMTPQGSDYAYGLYLSNGEI
jgi:predicted GH43/DUF377 family glycosyl hydrolase